MFPSLTKYTFGFRHVQHDALDVRREGWQDVAGVHAQAAHPVDAVVPSRPHPPPGCTLKRTATQRGVSPRRMSTLMDTAAKPAGQERERRRGSDGSCQHRGRDRHPAGSSETGRDRAREFGAQGQDPVRGGGDGETRSGRAHARAHRRGRERMGGGR